MKSSFVKDKPNLKLDSFNLAMKDGLKQPYIGVTQGGSSRKDAGARPAATSSTSKGNKNGRR